MFCASKQPLLTETYSLPLTFPFHPSLLLLVSGQIPSEPVVSKTSGHLYEKRLILKSINEDGKCPATGEDLATEDLLELKSS